MLVGWFPGAIETGPPLGCGVEPVRSINWSAFVPCSVSTAKPLAESRAMLLGRALAPSEKHAGNGIAGGAGCVRPGQGRGGTDGFGLKFAKVGCTATLVVADWNSGTGGVTCGALLTTDTSYSPGFCRLFPPCWLPENCRELDPANPFEEPSRSNFTIGVFGPP